MELIFPSSRDVCPDCEQYMYRKRVRLYISELRVYGMVDAWECLCGTWVMDRLGQKRMLTAQYVNPETVDNLRQIAEELKGTETPQEAHERFNRMLLEDE